MELKENERPKNGTIHFQRNNVCVCECVFFNYMKREELSHVVSGANLNEDVHSVVVWDSIDGGLDGLELAGAVHVDGDYAVADGPLPPEVVLGRVCGRH